MLYKTSDLKGLVNQLSERFRVLSRPLRVTFIALIVVTSVAPLATPEAKAYVRVTYRGGSYYRYPYRYRGSYHYRGGVYRTRYYRNGRWHYY